MNTKEAEYQISIYTFAPKKLIQDLPKKNDTADYLRIKKTNQNTNYLKKA